MTDYLGLCPAATDIGQFRWVLTSAIIVLSSFAPIPYISKITGPLRAYITQILVGLGIIFFCAFAYKAVFCIL